MRDRSGRLVVVLCLLSASGNCRFGLLLLTPFVQAVAECDAHFDRTEMGRTREEDERMRG